MIGDGLTAAVSTSMFASRASAGVSTCLDKASWSRWEDVHLGSPGNPKCKVDLGAQYVLLPQLINANIRMTYAELLEAGVHALDTKG